MIDVDFHLTVSDGARRFDLAARFATNAPFAARYGPSGAGKALTFQAIAGVNRPSKGHVRLDDRVLFDAAQGIDVPAHERRIGYLFQNYALFPHLSVRENVAFGLTSWRRRRLSPEDAQRIDALLQNFDLAALAASRPRTLSGGQQQRVALARALACRPRMLLLDEPFAALNPMLRHTVRQDLAAMQRDWNIPVLMITHDIDDVLDLADVAFVYEAGQVAREVDLRGSTSRDLMAQKLGVPAPHQETPRRSALRWLLQGRQEPCR
jgi:molybdate transport system ATP-binding protein